MREDRLQKEFTKAYEDLSDAIFRHCYFRLSNRERALDLMQETFLRAWDMTVDGKQKIRSLKALLYKIASNLIIDEYRTRKETVSIESLRESGRDIGSMGKEESGAETAIEVERIMGVLDKIDEKHKDAVVMKYIDELSLKEMAEATGEGISNMAIIWRCVSIVD